jgi:hypothetical protein
MPSRAPQAPLAIGQRRKHRVEGLVGDLDHLLVGAVLDGVLDVDRNRARAECLALGVSSGAKFRCGDEC